MAYNESDHFEMQESCSTSIQPIHVNVSADYETPPMEEVQDYSTYLEPLDDAYHDENIYQDPRDDDNSYLEFPLDDATNNDSTNQERLQTTNIRQRRNPYIETNYETAPYQVSETSPSKRIMMGLLISLIGLFIGVILALVLAAFSISIARGEEQEQQRAGTGSSSYIRWGRSECPNETADIAYTGYAAGANWFHDGSGSNYLCLYETPEYDSHVPGLATTRAQIYGVEYEVSDFPPFASQHNHDMNCAVCRVATRGTMVMIPAKITCPSGWTREYFGYLMSSRWDHKRTEFICVDRNPEAVQGTHESESGSVIYPAEVRCLNPDPAKYSGGLPCDKFPYGNELSCVVCTK